jgi:hypothetical protein
MPIPIAAAALFAGRMLLMQGIKQGLKQGAKKGVKKSVKRATKPRKSETSHDKRLRRGGFDRPGWAQQSKNFR